MQTKKELLDEYDEAMTRLGKLPSHEKCDYDSLAIIAVSMKLVVAVLLDIRDKLK
jgi:hypothetical protein